MRRYINSLFSFAEPSGLIDKEYLMPDSSYKFTETRAMEYLYFSAFSVKNISMRTAMKPNM
jgi:hypothetical protein